MEFDPALLGYMLSKYGHNGIYEALDSGDISDLVMISVNILKTFKYKLQLPPDLERPGKTEATSTAFRNEGNTAYKAGKYQNALEFYNKALLHAPIESLAMKLAYSNRSVLFLKVEEFWSCLHDIDICLAMGCPEDIVKKLKKRKEKAQEYAQAKNFSADIKKSTFCNDFFKLSTSRNPQIPCASAAVGIITEDQVPRVVATTDIKVGTVVAVETAFVSQTLSKYSSCHHCHKMSLNLIPCNKCCFALFCDEDCMKSSIDGYHDIECQFLDVIYSFDVKVLLAVQASLKIRKMCTSWKELVTASQKLGIERIVNSSIKDIFDLNRKFSTLSFRDDKHFIHGAMYNSSFTCAIIIDYLDAIQTFFPQSLEEKKDAMKAIARILMFLIIYGNLTLMRQPVSIAVQGVTAFHQAPSFGLFSFTGKLKHTCNPNLLVAGLNNAVALIALQPIKCGTELTIAHFGHFLDRPIDKNVRKMDLIRVYGIACNCYICSGQWEMNDEYPLTEVQKRNFHKLKLEHMREHTFNPYDVSDMHQKLSKSLAFLQDVPYSKEYKDVYGLFRRCILMLQHAKCDNKIIDYIMNA